MPSRRYDFTVIETRRRYHLCFASITEGDLSSPARERCESKLFGRLRASGIDVTMVAVNEDGCAFATDHHDLRALEAAVRELNVALRLRTGCARVALVRRSGRSAIPPVARLIGDLADAGIGIVHLSADDDALSVLVDETDATAAAHIMERCTLAESNRAA